MSEINNNPTKYNATIEYSTLAHYFDSLHDLNQKVWCYPHSFSSRMSAYYYSLFIHLSFYSRHNHTEPNMIHPLHVLEPTYSYARLRSLARLHQHTRTLAYAYSLVCTNVPVRSLTLTRSIVPTLARATGRARGRTHRVKFFSLCRRALTFSSDGRTRGLRTAYH
jgi:hypothetical protein